MTSSLQFNKCYLENIRIVFNHDIKSDLIFSHGAYFKQLAKNLNGKLINHHVAQGAPPESSVVIVQSKKFNISFASSRIQIEIAGDRKHMKSESLYKLLKSKITEAKGVLESYFGRDNFKQSFTGIIGPVRFPQSMKLEKEELIQQLSSKFSDKIACDSLITFNTRLGYLDKKHNLYVNYEVQDYEVKNIQLKPDEAQSGVIDINKFPTVEKGVLLNLDVNNRPRIKVENPIEEVDEVINSFFYFIENNIFSI
ncbi:MAG: hypothetical protein ISR65_03410 [Bacteriovoracaceae bacterium]|nr:hypothetical protein [Bacteriovoracaceae bacterium]